MYETVLNLFHRYWRIDEKQRGPKSCKNGIEPTKIYHDLGRVVSLRTIHSWAQMIEKNSFINLSSPLGPD